jgi:hypothetical protein
VTTPRVTVAPDTSNLGIETISANKDLKEVAASAAFMEEPVTVEIAAPMSENSPNHVILNVNGINQPVFFGHPVTIRRKYVEVLARMKQTGYTQRATNYINPEDSNAMIPRTALVHPFQLIEDKNPKGRAWLQHILQEAA